MISRTFRLLVSSFPAPSQNTDPRPKAQPKGTEGAGNDEARGRKVRDTTSPGEAATPGGCVCSGVRLYFIILIQFINFFFITLTCNAET